MFMKLSITKTGKTSFENRGAVKGIMAHSTDGILVAVKMLF